MINYVARVRMVFSLLVDDNRLFLFVEDLRD